MATLYWGGNGDNWSDTTKWYSDAALTVGAGAVPGAADHAVFNANAPGNCILNVNGACRTLTFVGCSYRLVASIRNLTLSPQDGDTIDLRNIGGSEPRPLYATSVSRMGTLTVQQVEDGGNVSIYGQKEPVYAGTIIFYIQNNN